MNRTRITEDYVAHIRGVCSAIQKDPKVVLLGLVCFTCSADLIEDDETFICNECALGVMRDLASVVVTLLDERRIGVEP